MECKIADKIGFFEKKTAFLLLTHFCTQPILPMYSGGWRFYKALHVACGAQHARRGAALLSGACGVTCYELGMVKRPFSDPEGAPPHRQPILDVILPAPRNFAGSQNSVSDAASAISTRKFSATQDFDYARLLLHRETSIGKSCLSPAVSYSL